MRKIVQLITSTDTGRIRACLCDDGTAWEWTAAGAPRERWVRIPEPKDHADHGVDKSEHPNA